MSNQHIREGNILKRAMSVKFFNAMTKVGGFLAGGAIRAVFTGERISDFDIFFKSQTDFDLCVKLMAEDSDPPSFTTTDTAWTHIDKNGDHYQLICAAFGESDVVIRQFDFTCCMAAWRVPYEFILDENFMKHCAQRRLVFNVNAGYPICSMWRVSKFIKRGWRLSGLEAIKLGLAINNLKMKDHKELKRQLMGIDTLFLKELTDGLALSKDVAYDFGEAIDFIISFADKETANESHSRE